MTDTKLRVAIIGGGIAGLAAAASLHDQGMEVSVYEQADQLGEVGAGIMLAPNSRRQLERMGMTKALADVGAPIGTNSGYYRHDGTRVSAVQTTDSSGWSGLYGMHRADMLSLLAAQVPASIIHAGHKCVGYEEKPEGAQVTFANGVVIEADIVIGADGIQSVLQSFVTEPSAPVHSGSVAYRGLLPRSKVPWWSEDAIEVWMGQGKHFLVFPVRGGTMINYVAFIPTNQQTRESWSAIGDRDALAAEFVGWDPRVTGLLDQVETCFWWGLYDRAPLASWTKGRLVLIGDAAHPMLPHLGQGANQGMEDGFALSVFLNGKGREDVAETLHSYEQFRRERADTVQAESRRNGHRYDSKYDSLEQRDTEIEESKTFRKWLYDYDVHEAARAHITSSATGGLVQQSL